MKVIITLGAPVLKNMEPSVHMLSRLQETRMQYNKNDIVIVTGARCQKQKLSEAQIMHDWLRKYDITAIKEERAMNTIQNAIFTRKLIENNSIPSTTHILVITSDFHIARASLIFLHYFKGLSMFFRPVPTVQPDVLVQKEPTFLVQLVQNFPPRISEEQTLIDEVKCGYFEGVKEKIAQITRKDKLNNTALHWASSYGFVEIAQYLIDKGANVNDKNLNDMTPLHYAVIFGRIEAVWLLLTHGANVSLRARNQRWVGELTPIECIKHVRQTLSPETYAVITLLLNKFNPKASTVWIRHAESVFNFLLATRQNVTGVYDSPLTNSGIEVASAINFWIQKYNLLEDYIIFVSPLTRTLQTCSILTKNVQVRKPIVISDIAERVNHCNCIGETREELEKKYDYEFSGIPSVWWYKPNLNNRYRIDNGEAVVEEKWQEMGERVDKFRSRLNSQELAQNKKVLVVAHGGVILHLTGYETRVRNCDVFVT
jgi:broad specificity phosphatase PhoE